MQSLTRSLQESDKIVFDRSPGDLLLGRSTNHPLLFRSCFADHDVHNKQLHFPFPYVGGMEALAEGLAAACDRGMCRSVGVSNFNAKQVMMRLPVACSCVV